MKMAKQPDIPWADLGAVAISIDAANVIYSLRDLGWRMDYKRLKRFFDLHAQLASIYFYAAYFEGDDGRNNLFEMLSRKGFILRTKAVKTIRTKTGILHKANCDVELTMDAMTAHADFDAAVLMSGDSDFVPLVKFLQSQGKQVVVISTRGHVARELVDAADYYGHFGQFQEQWQQSTQPKNPAKRGSRCCF